MVVDEEGGMIDRIEPGMDEAIESNPTGWAEERGGDRAGAGLEVVGDQAE